MFELMTKWIERYRRQARERYRQLDAVAEMPTSPPAMPQHRPHERQEDTA